MSLALARVTVLVTIRDGVSWFVLLYCSSQDAFLGKK